MPVKPPDEAAGPFTDVDGPALPLQAGSNRPAYVSDGDEILELREERLVAHKELRDAGDITVRTEIEEVPGRLEIDAYREEIVIEHEPVGQVVRERDQPWEMDGVLVLPVYEEQLVVIKRLVLKERLHIRRVSTTERQLFEDTLRHERLVIDDPQQTGLVREHYPTGDLADEGSAAAAAPGETDSEREAGSASESGGLLEQLVRKALA